MIGTIENSLTDFFLFSCTLNIQHQRYPVALDEINNDPQRLMVDAMFMIVYNLRLFLTAVSPNAVTPF